MRDGRCTMGKRFLWVGDAVLPTGFARVTHNVCTPLVEKHGWDGHVLGINYDGDPGHGYPYPIYPASTGGDLYGKRRLGVLARHLKPDIICILQDPWVVCDYLDLDVPPEIPIVAYMPVDGQNIARASGLNGLATGIWYTEFGKKEALAGGYRGPCDVIPHGVDTSVYTPGDRNQARQDLGLEAALAVRKVAIEDAFIVMNINRNQPRKRLDLTIQVFAQWWHKAGRPANAFVFFHCARVDLGFDLVQLARWYGVQQQIIMSNAKYSAKESVREADLANMYRAGDLGLTTTRGEGWGLTTLEGMACRRMQAVPRFAALAEWAKDAVQFAEVSHIMVEPRVNIIGATPSVTQMVQILDRVYHDAPFREHWADKAYERAIRPEFQWSSVSARFNDVFTRVVSEGAHTHADDLSQQASGGVNETPAPVLGPDAEEFIGTEEVGHVSP